MALEKAQIFFKGEIQAIGSSGKERLQNLQKSLENKGASSPQGADEKIFEVQFNPNQLSISAQNRIKKAKESDEKSIHSIAGKKKDNRADVQEPTLSLKVKLMFASREDSGYSVQKDIELFLAAVRNPLTREIIFGWKQFLFIGKLNSVEANYTMFNKKGNPIRGEVSLSIKQDSDNGLFRF